MIKHLKGCMNHARRNEAMRHGSVNQHINGEINESTNEFTEKITLMYSGVLVAPAMMSVFLRLSSRPMDLASRSTERHGALRAK